ncbi:hypothetical protein GH714_003278 [Hevea brasiliensis]|uniref:Protein kinase domain-containing protein n=1 Tax=Hevea brasiliensis TaxID=3981 RepID=A0A6A6KRR2_HEVBR|nr:hypothetical protein GH714_003278 [Hevea brasiliensis]
MLGVGCTLTWSKRMKIASHAARGLAFLHGAERSIIYRDFKTSNILLEGVSCHCFVVHDLQLAILHMVIRNSMQSFQILDLQKMDQWETRHVSTRVMGTYGYAAPEYVITGPLPARSDVYGFGAVRLELLLGRKALDKDRPSREHNMVEWARPLLNHNRKVLKILDPRIEGQYSVKTAMKVANLAHQCLSQNPKGRPPMSQEVELLEGFQSKDEDEMFQSNEKGVTLYEDPGLSLCTPQTRNPNTSIGRHKSSNGRSNSEPSPECDLCNPCPDVAVSSPLRN